MIVLSASRLVVAAAVVVVAVVVLWPAVDVAVLWFVVAVLSVESVLTSLLKATTVRSDLVVPVEVHVFVSGPDLLHPVSSSSRACPSRLVIPSQLVLSHITVALCETHRWLPSAPMTFGLDLPIKLFLNFALASTSIAAIQHLRQNWDCFLNRPPDSKSGRSVFSRT